MNVAIPVTTSSGIKKIYVPFSINSTISEEVPSLQQTLENPPIQTKPIAIHAPTKPSFTPSQLIAWIIMRIKRVLLIQND